jgi:hypothetical protein
MEKEFVPYAEALALKELGFDEPCLTYYEEDKYLKQVFVLQYNKFELFSYKNVMFDNDGTKEIATPTFSQAFRWFREKYGLYSHVRESLAFDKTLEFVTQINGSYVNHGIEDKPVNRFETYEEAELACLVKLIYIVKASTNLPEIDETIDGSRF